jgi:Rieske Fe-S protein
VGRSRLGKILVVRRRDGLVGLTATCTHLGCTVAWNGANGQVECPCHGARYNLHGEVLNGPAREPLTIVSVTVEPDGIRVRPQLQG